MGAKTAIPVEQYLHTSFPDLDREYHDGEIVERASPDGLGPDYLHGRTQGALIAFFLALRSTLALFPCVETRMRLRPNLVLIPDVAVFYKTEPPSVPETPPLIVIEVFSVDDRLNTVREKLEEYKRWGVAHVWLVDPHAKCLYTCEPKFGEATSLTVPELNIELKPTQIFD